MELKDIPGIKRNSAAVRHAREKLAAESEEIVERFKTAIGMAIAAGEYEAGLKAFQWLIEHLPAKDGQKILDPGIDKQQVESGPRGPLIQIGIVQGGIAKKALPSAPELPATAGPDPVTVIEVQPEPEA
jgi:hypothetical protein